MKNYRTKYNNITPINKQIQLDPSRTSMSKTDAEGIIEYANEAFMKVCGFSKSELMGQPHSIVRHPDMPKVIFKLMWERISKGEGIYAVVKNLTKNGSYYWVIAKINSKLDEQGNPLAHYARRKAAPEYVIKKVENLYKTLREIEDSQSPEVAEKYFYGLLEDLDVTYDEFFISIIGNKQVSMDSFFANLTARNQTKEEKEKEIKDEFALQTEKKQMNSKPIPLNKEIRINPSKTIMSKTNAEGIIEYTNNYFMEVCKYKEYELIGQPHNIIRHPDMPKVIFQFMWERLYKGKNIHALVKNLAKDGSYYWVLTNFETKYDENGKIISHYAYQKAAPGNAIYQIEQLYSKLLAIEKNQGAIVSERYFRGLLEEKKITYDEFILQILNTSKETIQNYFKEEEIIKNNTKGFLKKLFS